MTSNAIDIFKMVIYGRSLIDTGIAFSVSSDRVRQIFKKTIVAINERIPQEELRKEFPFAQFPECYGDTEYSEFNLTPAFLDRLRRNPEYLVIAASRALEERLPKSRKKNEHITNKHNVLHELVYLASQVKLKLAIAYTAVLSAPAPVGVVKLSEDMVQETIELVKKMSYLAGMPESEPDFKMAELSENIYMPMFSNIRPNKTASLLSNKAAYDRYKCWKKLLEDISAFHLIFPYAQD